MDKQLTYRSHAGFLKWVNLLLLLVLLIKIAGFFTWSENIAVTRIMKVLMRVGMTIAVFGIHQVIVKRGAVASYRWKNSLSPLLYAAYLLLGFISFLWSTNVSYSALQWFMDLESFVFAWYFIQCFLLLDAYYPAQQIRFYKVLGDAIFIIMLVFIVGMFAAPDEFYRMTHGGEEARLGGYFMNPNELGMLCVVGISALLFNLKNPKQKAWTILKILALLYALVMTGSRSSTIGVLLIAFFHIRQSRQVYLRYAMYALAILAIPLAVEKMMIKENGGGLDEVMSMTGRLPFWEALLTEGLPQEPWLGFGFMRIAYKDYFQGVHTYAGQMTHNTFIQVLMNLGFVGFTLVLFQLLFTLRGFIQTQEQEKKLLLFGILIPILINSFTEFGIFGETNYGILFYQLLIFYISRELNTNLSPAEKIFLRKRRPDLILHSQQP